jgi:hypothetical protein
LRQLSLIAAVKKKQSPVPVFLIYAGIVHAIGLALLVPMLITLPGPGSGIAPEPTAIDVEIVPAPPLAAKIEQDGEQTSALSAAPPLAADDAPVEAGPEVANVSPAEGADAAPVEEEPVEAISPAQEQAKPETAKPAKAGAAKKSGVQRRATAKPAVRRSAKTQTKITPFNGALTGLFSPGAPANRRR